jgi:hypothetical protein
MRHFHVIGCMWTMLALAGGCGKPAAPPSPKTDPALAAVEADPETTKAIQDALTQVINEATIRYIPLEYNYDEGLLEKLDLIESRLSHKEKAPTTRLLPKLDEGEELDHFRETTRRWEASTGKKLRASIDPLKADVAARKPGIPYHPEFHKKFAAEFDDFIKIEVNEARERRNRQVHREAKPIFDKYRPTHPEIVSHFEQSIDSPPYNLDTGSSGSHVSTSPTSQPKP